MKKIYSSFLHSAGLKIHILGLIVLLLCVNQAQAQCTNAPEGQWPSGTITGPTSGPICPAGAPPYTSITTSAYTGEYSVLTLAVQTYTVTSSVATDYITITDATGATVISSGIQPYQFAIAVAGTYRVYRHSDAACATQATNRTISIGCNSCSPAAATVVTSQSSSAVTNGGANDVQLVRLAVSNKCGTLTQLNLSTTGTTNVLDIARAKVYYTTSTTFSNAVQFGSTVVSPSGAFAVTGSQALSTTLTNYFWVVYDLNCAAPATAANVADATIESFVVDAATTIPATTSPAGTRLITPLYAPAFASVGSASYVQGTTNDQIVRLNLNGSTLCPGTLTSVTFNTSTSTSPAADILQAKCYYTTTTTFSTASQFGTAVVTPSGDITFTGSQVLANGTGNYFWLVYDINCVATLTDVLNGIAVNAVVNATTYAATGAVPTAKTITAATGGTYNTVADGNWSSPGTWACGNVPSATTPVQINNNITVNTVGNISGNITITSSGNLSIVSGDLTIGNSAAGTAKNSSLTNNGIFDISGGMLKVNGSILCNLLSTFNQSGGDIVVDGNNGGATATSVPSGTRIIDFRPSAANSVNLTGGTLTIVDPHAAASSEALYLNGSFAGEVNTTANHTLILGDGVSTDAGGTATYGYRINPWAVTTGISFGKVIVNNAPGTNRAVTTTYTLITKGDLVINAGADLNLTTLAAVAGNLVNNGTYTAGNTIYFGKLAFATGSTYSASAGTNLQSISGTGVLRNSATTPTANLSSLEIYTAHPNGFVLNSPLTLSGTLFLDSGIVRTSSTNLLTVGVSAATPGTITPAFGMVAGPLKKWFATTVGATILPLSNGTVAKPVTINVTTALTTGGTLTGEFSSAAPAFPNAAPLMEGALKVDKASKQGSWFINAADGFAGGAYTATFTGTGATDIIDYTKTVLIKRPSAGGDWTLDGTHVTTTGSNTAPVLSRTGMTGFSEFAIGGENLVVLPIGIEYINGSKLASGNSINWKINVSNSSSATMYLERSSDNRTFQTIYNLTASATRSLQPFQYMDIAPASGINYYRLKSVDANGNVKYSAVIAIINSDKGAEIISIVPNPVKNVAILNVSSAIATKMDIVVTDMSGRKISKQSVSLIAGSNQLPLNFAGLSAGSYQVTGYTADGQLRTMRFVKQ